MDTIVVRVAPWVRMIRFTLIRHYRDNVLDPENEMRFEWPDFTQWLISNKHELRGDGSGNERPFKEGERGASRPTAMLPADPRWGCPSIVEDEDRNFMAKHAAHPGRMRRVNRNISGASSMVVLDLDDLTPAEYEEMNSRIDQLDLDAIEYSSWSHGVNLSRVKVRVIIRLDRDQTIEEIPRVRRGAAIALGVRNDGQTCAAANLFFLPSTDPSRAHHAFFDNHTGGEALEVDDLLDLTPETSAEIRDRLETELGVAKYDGRPATDEEKARAEATLDQWCIDLSSRKPGDVIRDLTKLASHRIGRYAAAKALDMESARARMHRTYDYLLENGFPDRKSKDERLKQIDDGLREGSKRPMLPPPKEVQDKVDAALEIAKEGRTCASVAQQLDNNRPYELVDLETARRRSYEFGLTVKRGELIGDFSTAGTGKSFNIAKLAAHFAKRGELVVVQTQENAVGAQTRAELKKLAPDVDSVQVYSPLSPPAGADEEDRCPRAGELAEVCHEFTIPLRRLCAKCPLAAHCPALEAHKDRTAKLKTASVVFVSQAGIHQAGSHLEGGAILFTDEQPSPAQRTLLPKAALEALATSEHINGLPWHISKDVSALAVQALGGPRAPELDPLQEWEPATDLLLNLDRDDRRAVRHAALLWDCAKDRLVGRPIAEGLEVWVNTAAHDAMVSYGGMLADATPFLPALPKGMRVLRQHVKDAVPVARRLIVAPGRGSSALVPENADEKKAARAQEAIASALSRAVAIGAPSTLFVTFKAVREWIEVRREEYGLPPSFQLAHFGAVRGKNTWREFDLVYVFGTPRFDRMPLVYRYVKESEDDAREAWMQMCSAEQEQALARVRPVSRSTPATMICESDVVPMTWYAGQDGLVVETLRAEALHVAGQLYLNEIPQEEIAAACGVSRSAVSRWSGRGVPPHHLPRLARLLHEILNAPEPKDP